MLDIRKLGDPVLRASCAPVESIDKEIESLIEAMCETLSGQPGGAGLAAPQVGVTARLLIYDAGFGPHALINPEIIEAEGECLIEEGCLSLPGIYVMITRHEQVKVLCQTPSGHHIILETSGFVAQLLQHECDHLDGVLLIDRCDQDEKERAIAEFEELERGCETEVL